MFLISNFLTQTTSTTTRRPTTTTTTTVRPRLFNYYEEGGWRILRQEEEKEKHKYDFLYHTENGIYGEEKAHLHPGAGTSASGYYEYTGDDGELYRVNYKSDHNGFIPEGDHIPTPPPVPDAIKKALEYTARRKETHGHVQTGHYEHKPSPVRLQNMPTIDRPLSPQQPIQQTPKVLPQLPTLAPLPSQPAFNQHSAPQRAQKLPTLAPLQRAADQLIQQTQLAQQSQPDHLPNQVQVPLPKVEAQKPVALEPVQVLKKVELNAAPVVLPQKVVKSPVAQVPLHQGELKPRVEEEHPQSDQPQADEPQADQPQADQPQADQPQADQPQADQPHQEGEPEQPLTDQLPTKEEQVPEEELKTEPSEDSYVIVKPEQLFDNDEVSPEASEQLYQVAEKLTDEENFELTMA